MSSTRIGSSDARFGPGADQNRVDRFQLAEDRPKLFVTNADPRSRSASSHVLLAMISNMQLTKSQQSSTR